MTEDQIRALVHDLHANLGTIRITLDLLASSSVTATGINVEELVSRASREVSRLAAGLDAVVALATRPAEEGGSELLEVLHEVAAVLRLGGQRVDVGGDEANVDVPHDRLRAGLRGLLGYVAADDRGRVLAEVIATPGSPVALRVMPVPAEIGGRTIALLADAVSASSVIEGDALVITWEAP